MPTIPFWDTDPPELHDYHLVIAFEEHVAFKEKEALGAQCKAVLEAHLPLRIVSTHEPSVSLPYRGNFNDRWIMWTRMSASRLETPRTLLVYVVPGHFLSESGNLIGYAGQTGVDHTEGSGLAAIAFTEDTKQLSYRILHELGHLLGAGHDDRGIMMRAGNELPPPYFSEKSRFEIISSLLKVSGPKTSFQSYREEVWDAVTKKGEAE